MLRFEPYPTLIAPDQARKKPIRTDPVTSSLSVPKNTPDPLV
jgi:hypothetical protein